MASNFIDGTGNSYVVKTAIGAYANERYTLARRLSNSGFVSRNSTINTDDETFTGQMRWRQPMNPVINIASLVDPTDGVPSNFSTAFLNYVKTVRTSGAQKINLTEVVTSEDGLVVFGNNFAETRMTDENNAILAILKGVAISEAMRGASNTGLGGQTFDNDPTNGKYGFYVDMGNDPIVSATGAGAGRIQELIEALGMAFKDYEPEFAYLVANPQLMAAIRSANLIDQDRVTDGSIEFESILDGKLRIVKSRVNTSLTPAEMAKINGGNGVDIVGAKTSFICLPGAIAMESVALSAPIGIDTDESAYHGGGTTEAWYRWGYVAHPAGYDWQGPKTKFPSDLNYQAVQVTPDTPVALTDASVTAITINTAKPVWNRATSSALSLGILPIFHG